MEFHGTGEIRMVKRLLFALLLASAARAQQLAQPPVTLSETGTFTFAKPVGATDTCVVWAFNLNGNGTVPALPTGWTIAAQSKDTNKFLFVSQPCTLPATFAPTGTAFEGMAADYAGLAGWPLDVANAASGNTASPAITLNVAQQDFVIAGFAEQGPTYLTIQPSAGMTLEGAWGSDSYALTDGSLASGQQSVGITWEAAPFAPLWTELVAAFKPPGPAPQSIPIALSGTLSSCVNCTTPPTDVMPLANYTVTVSECNGNPCGTVPLGNFTTSSSGAVSGTVTVSTNLQDMPTIYFQLYDSNGNPEGLIMETVPGAMFGKLHSITGFSIVVTGCPTLCTLAPGTNFGTIQ